LTVLLSRDLVTFEFPNEPVFDDKVWLPGRLDEVDVTGGHGFVLESVPEDKLKISITVKVNEWLVVVQFVENAHLGLVVVRLFFHPLLIVCVSGVLEAGQCLTSACFFASGCFGFGCEGIIGLQHLLLPFVMTI
jgi:hypothetical protein